MHYKTPDITKRTVWLGTLKNPHCWMAMSPSTGQNLQPFTIVGNPRVILSSWRESLWTQTHGLQWYGKGDVSVWVKNSWVGWKINKQTNEAYLGKRNKRADVWTFSSFFFWFTFTQFWGRTGRNDSESTCFYNHNCCLLLANVSHVSDLAREPLVFNFVFLKYLRCTCT